MGLTDVFEDNSGWISKQSMEAPTGESIMRVTFLLQLLPVCIGHVCGAYVAPCCIGTNQAAKRWFKRWPLGCGLARRQLCHCHIYRCTNVVTSSD